MIYIYALTDPRDKTIRYIGQTNNVERRYIEHCNTNENTVKGAWIKELRALGLTPTICVLEQVERSDDADYREKWWITLAQRHGWQLGNTANPSRRKAVFGEMFSEQLRQEYDAFRSAIRDQSPFMMITWGHVALVMMLLKLLTALAVGLVVGWSAWHIEYSVAQNVAASVWQSVTMGIAMTIMIAHALLHQVKHRWMALSYASLWFLVGAYQLWGWS